MREMLCLVHVVRMLAAVCYRLLSLNGRISRRLELPQLVLRVA